MNARVPDNSEIVISGPSMVVLTPQVLSVIMGALENLPFRTASPVINDLTRQLRAQVRAPTAGDPVEAASGE